MYTQWTPFAIQKKKSKLNNNSNNNNKTTITSTLVQTENILPNITKGLACKSLLILWKCFSGNKREFQQTKMILGVYKGARRRGTARLAHKSSRESWVHNEKNIPNASQGRRARGRGAQAWLVLLARKRIEWCHYSAKFLAVVFVVRGVIKPVFSPPACYAKDVEKV